MSFQNVMSDEAARRVLAGVHDIARWLHRLSQTGVSVETRLEEPILDAVLDAYGVPRDRRTRDPLYAAFYGEQERALTERELDVILQAAREIASGDEPDALEALGEPFPRAV